MRIGGGRDLFESRLAASGAPLAFEHVLAPTAYRRVRPEVLGALLRHKRARRLQLGALASIVFESRATAWFQVQEELRFHPAPKPRHVREVLDRINVLVAPAGELRATLLLEAATSMHALAIGDLSGMELHLGDTRFVARPVEAEELDAVSYLRFVPAGRSGRASAFVWPALRQELPLEAPTIASLRRFVPASSGASHRARASVMRVDAPQFCA